jgi:hypothetical protein
VRDAGRWSRVSAGTVLATADDEHDDKHYEDRDGDKS